MLRSPPVQHSLQVVCRTVTSMSHTVIIPAANLHKQPARCGAPREPTVCSYENGAVHDNKIARVLRVLALTRVRSLRSRGCSG